MLGKRSADKVFVLEGQLKVLGFTLPFSRPYGTKRTFGILLPSDKSLGYFPSSRWDEIERSGQWHLLRGSGTVFFAAEAEEVIVAAD